MFPPRRGSGPNVGFDALSEAFTILGQDFGVWALCGFLYFVILEVMVQPITFGLNAILIGNPLGITTDPSAKLTVTLISIPLNLVATAIGMVFQAGMIDMAVRKQEGYPIAVGDMFVGTRKFFPLFIASLLQILMMAFGSLLCLIPGLYALAVLPFTPILVLRQNMSPTDALQYSYNTLKPHALMSFALLFVAGICSALGLIACCVGIALTISIQPIVVGVLYYNFFSQPVANPVGQDGFTPYPRGVQQSPFGSVPASTPEAPIGATEIRPTPEDVLPEPPEMPEPPEPPSPPTV